MRNIFKWLLRLLNLDSASRSVGKFLHGYANWTGYPEITRDALKSFDELHFDTAVVEYVNVRINEECKEHDRELDIVSRMSPGIQAVYTTWYVQTEVNEGGLHQYFYNKGVEWAFMAVEGYKRLGAPKHAALMLQAIEIYLDEELDQRAIYSGRPEAMIDDYVEARKVSALPALDSQFAGLLKDESIIGLAFDYMRHHVDEFITHRRRNAT